MKVKEVIKKHADMIKLFIAMIVILVGMSLIMSGFFTYQSDSIPNNITLSYRTVELGIGGFLFYSGAQYFVFDTNGHRYQVSRDVFDAYKDLPRK